MKRCEAYGPLTRDEIATHIKEAKWQHLRVMLLGESLEFKLDLLDAWLRRNHFNRQSQVQVLNYINALKRGGIL